MWSSRKKNQNNNYAHYAKSVHFEVFSPCEIKHADKAALEKNPRNKVAFDKEFEK